MSDDIPAPTIFQLTTELVDVNDWYFLGLALRVHPNKLEEIQKSSPQEGIKRWKIGLLSYWLNSTPDASWNDIIVALKTIGHDTLSTKLREKYILPLAGQQDCSTPPNHTGLAIGTTASGCTAMKQKVTDSSKPMDSMDSSHLCSEIQSLLEQMKTFWNTREFEEENQKLKSENQRLKRELEQMIWNTREFEEENQKLKSENQRLKWELEQMIWNTRIITVADIQKQTPLITTGEPTLREAKIKYIKQTEHALYELSEKITDFPKEKNMKFCSHIFQEAYDTCKCHLLEEFKIKLETLVTMPADRGLESWLTADEEEHYSDLQRAYGLLLSACKIKGSPVPIDQVAEKIKLKHETSGLLPHFLPLINDAVSIAWKMLILSPPAVLCTPEKFFEEWQTARGFPDVKERYYSLVYYRPLMLSHVHGPPVVKAMVKKVASSERTPNEESA